MNFRPKQFEKDKSKSCGTIAQQFGELNIHMSKNNNTSNDTNLSSAGEEDESDDDFSDIPVNTNRPPEIYESDTEESSDED